MMPGQQYAQAPPQASAYGPNPVAAAPAGPEIDDRKAALIDVAYLITGFYVCFFSLSPIFGIPIGLMLLLGGSHPKTKRLGKIALIISGIGFLLFIGYLVFVLLIAAAAS